MKTTPQGANRGIALIIVMIVITFFSIMVAGFAYSMKVETRLARNSGFTTEMDWMGRSGMELAKYVLGQQRAIEPFDALNQKWAGGPGNSNSILADVKLDNLPIGKGTISVKITDCERKFNVNVTDAFVLGNALNFIGVDPADSQGIVASIQDWIDRDDALHQGGAESSFYESQDPPYKAKNGPIDDISELLLIKGVTPELYWGTHNPAPPSVTPASGAGGLRPTEPLNYPIGLVDAFSPFGARVNINTVSATVLQMFPEIDENIANAIVQFRAGPDGADGTEDDMPFRSAAQITMVPGLPPPLLAQISRYFTTQSSVFEVEVKVQVNDIQRSYFAIIRRVDARNLQTLNVWWK